MAKLSFFKLGSPRNLFGQVFRDIPSRRRVSMKRRERKKKEKEKKKEDIQKCDIFR